MDVDDELRRIAQEQEAAERERQAAFAATDAVKADWRQKWDALDRHFYDLCTAADTGESFEPKPEIVIALAERLRADGADGWLPEMEAEIKAGFKNTIPRNPLKELWFIVARLQEALNPDAANVIHTKLLALSKGDPFKPVFDGCGPVDYVRQAFCRRFDRLEDEAEARRIDERNAAIDAAKAKEAAEAPAPAVVVPPAPAPKPRAQPKAGKRGRRHKSETPAEAAIESALLKFHEYEAGKVRRTEAATPAELVKLSGTSPAAVTRFMQKRFDEERGQAAYETCCRQGVIARKLFLWSTDAESLSAKEMALERVAHDDD